MVAIKSGNWENLLRNGLLTQLMTKCYYLYFQALWTPHRLRLWNMTNQVKGVVFQ